MTVQQDVPTGAEVRAHIERWRELEGGERPIHPIEMWFTYGQAWKGRVPTGVDVGFIPDDDTPQPGLRLVALPVAPETERVPWWEAVGRIHACGRPIDSITTHVGGAILRDSEGEVIEVVYSHVGTVEVLVESEPAVPVDMVPEPEPWVPQVGDDVLVTARVLEGADSDGDLRIAIRWVDGTEHSCSASLSSLRPWTERDGD